MMMIPLCASLLLGCPVSVKAPAAFVEREVKKASAKGADVAGVLLSAMDWQAVPDAILRQSWATLDSNRRAEFVAALRGRLARQIRAHRADLVTWKLARFSESGLTVRTVAQIQRGAQHQAYSLSIDLVRREDGCLGVLDVSVDGVSMIRNLRAQAERVLERRGWAALIAQLGRE